MEPAPLPQSVPPKPGRLQPDCPPAPPPELQTPGSSLGRVSAVAKCFPPPADSQSAPLNSPKHCQGEAPQSCLPICFKSKSSARVVPMVMVGFHGGHPLPSHHDPLEAWPCNSLQPRELGLPGRPLPHPGEKREKQREAFKIPLWRDKHRSHFRTGISALGLASFPHSRDGH